MTDPISNQQYRIYAPISGRVLGMALNQVVLPGFRGLSHRHRNVEVEHHQQGGDDSDEGPDAADEDQRKKAVGHGVERLANTPEMLAAALRLLDT